MAPRFQNIPALDGLRGIAVLVVMFYHCTIKNLFIGGFIGVDIFFVISGFLITTILLNEWHTKNRIDLKAFYMRRCFRLLPALLGLLIVFVSFGVVFSNDVFSFFRDAFWALSYIANWARVYSDHGPDFLGHTWSLSIEEQFYIVWPFIFVILVKYIKSYKTIFIFLFLSAIAVAILRYEMRILGSSVNRIYNGLDTRSDTLLLGCASAFLFTLIRPDEPQKLKMINIMRHVALAAFGGLFLISQYASYHNDAMINYGYFMTALLSAVVVLCLPFLQHGLLVSFLHNSWLISCGKISYGLYLWHYPILRMLHDHFHLHWTLKLIVGIPLSFLMAMVSFYVIEKPFLIRKSTRETTGYGGNGMPVCVKKINSSEI
jgi:peptidoglycan/LPS O-acetylase OafA/YrhL